ncbi:hypothetical protein P5V15_004071 [Pogonomyrmex californicus]
MTISALRDGSSLVYLVAKLQPFDLVSTKERHPCPKCSRIFEKKGSLSRHLLYACGKEPRFKCPYCQYCCNLRNVNGSFKVFSRSFSSNADKRFSCPNHNCGRAFNWKRNLTRHLKYECGRQPRFKCPYCDYHGKLKGNVKKHLLHRHKNRKIYVVDLFQETA